MCVHMYKSHNDLPGTLLSVYVCAAWLAIDRFCRYNEFRDIEEPEDDVRVLFAAAADETTDISNALALDMTYRVLYYGQLNQVGMYLL